MIRASQILFWFGLSIAASLALYHTSDRTRELEHQLRSIDALMDAEQDSIHVLKAEWVYLANPARVEAETKKHLTLRATAPKQVIGLKALDEDLPTRTEAMESVAVSDTPIASVSTKTTAMKPPEPPPDRKVASIDRNHVNNRMVIGRAITKTASVQRDQIGAYISGLSSRP